MSFFEEVTPEIREAFEAAYLADDIACVEILCVQLNLACPCCGRRSFQRWIESYPAATSSQRRYADSAPATVCCGACGMGYTVHTLLGIDLASLDPDGWTHRWVVTSS